MDFMIAVDARKASASEFLRGIIPGIPTREEAYAQMKKRIARLIEVGGSLYGYPPGAVDAVRAELAAKAGGK